MKTKHKTAVTAAALGAVLLAGGAGVATASGSDGPSTSSTTTTGGGGGQEAQDPGKDGDVEGDEAKITGTIKAPKEMPEDQEAKDGSAEEKAQDKAETAALAKLATVTEDQARTAATDAAPGTITEIELDDEDGFVVWEAEITQKDGTEVEVLIDAGNAKVLSQETEDADDDEDEDDAASDQQSSDTGSQTSGGQETTTN